MLVKTKGIDSTRFNLVLDHVQENCLKIQPEVENSIDEQIIPAKTKYSGIRQYNPQKPVKWGFKNFVRAGKSGMIYDLFIYTGPISATQKCTGEYVVLRLCKTLPRVQNYKLFFDNWFSSLPLCIKLKDLGIFSTATVRTDCLKKCPLATDKALMKEGKGSSSYQCDTNSGVTVHKWFDNKYVHLCSNHSNPCEMSTVERWDKVERKHVNCLPKHSQRIWTSPWMVLTWLICLISVYCTNIEAK